MILRHYQTAAIDLLRRSLATGHKRPLLCMPTGGGKTRIAVEIIKSALAKGKSVGFVVDRLQLVQQASDALEAAGIDHGIMQGDNEKTDRSKPIQVISVATLARRKWPESDLFIIDEAHILHKAHKEIMTKWNAVPIVGLSATPWTKGLGNWFDDLVLPTSIAELIEGGFLVDADVFAPDMPDMTGVKTVGGDFSGKEVAKRMSNLVLVANIQATYAKLAMGKRALVMAADVAHSKQVVDTFNLQGIRASHIDAYTDSDDRREAIASFRRGETLVLSSCGVLTTGFDAPEAEVLILARPTKSPMLHIQMVGRVLRPCPDIGKTRALILDHAGNFARMGWHTDPIPDELDDGKNNVSKKAAEKSEEKLPVACPVCHALRPAGTNVCPACGHVSKRKPKIETREGELKKIERAADKRNRLDSVAEKQAFYGGLLTAAAEKGRADGWAAHIYKDRYGVWPNAPEIRYAMPCEPSPTVRSYIRHHSIKYAKGRARRYS